MNNDYKELLTRSIQAAEITALATKGLDETSQKINDSLLSHNKTMAEIYQLSCQGNDISKANNTLLVKYLKYAIVFLVLLLGGGRVLAEAKTIIATFIL